MRSHPCFNSEQRFVNSLDLFQLRRAVCCCTVQGRHVAVEPLPFDLSRNRFSLLLSGAVQCPQRFALPLFKFFRRDTGRSSRLNFCFALSALNPSAVIYADFCVQMREHVLFVPIHVVLFGENFGHRQRTHTTLARTASRTGAAPAANAATGGPGPLHIAAD